MGNQTPNATTTGGCPGEAEGSLQMLGHFPILGWLYDVTAGINVGLERRRIAYNKASCRTHKDQLSA